MALEVGDLRVASGVALGVTIRVRLRLRIGLGVRIGLGSALGFGSGFCSGFCSGLALMITGVSPRARATTLPVPNFSTMALAQMAP